MLASLTDRGIESGWTRAGFLPPPRGVQVQSGATSQPQRITIFGVECQRLFAIGERTLGIALDVRHEADCSVSAGIACIALKRLERRRPGKPTRLVDRAVRKWFAYCMCV